MQHSKVNQLFRPIYRLSLIQFLILISFRSLYFLLSFSHHPPRFFLIHRLHKKSSIYSVYFIFKLSIYYILYFIFNFYLYVMFYILAQDNIIIPTHPTTGCSSIRSKAGGYLLSCLIRILTCVNV